MNELAGNTIPAKTSLSSFNLGNHRVDVAEPAVVHRESPVIVMHDGGNLLLSRTETWNGQNWGIIESLDNGLVAAELQPVVIGVYTGEGTSRYNELSPAPILEAVPNAFDSLPNSVLPADLANSSIAYQNFLAHEVLPCVAKRFGLALDPSRTAIGGSSMGGLASIFGLGLHPDVYSTALSFSTHWPFGGNTAVQLLIGALPSAGGGHRLWIDSGNTELDAAYPALHYAAIDELQKRGWLRDRDFEARLYAGTGHQERYWAARWPDAVNWWLSPTPR